MTKSRTNADNVTADIAGITAGTGITGGGTSGTVTITNDMATTIAAAGDLIYGTANDAYTRLGLGTAGQLLKVNSGATAPEWGAPPSAGANWSLLNSPSGTQLTAASTITISGISGADKIMILVNYAKAGASAAFDIRLNGDSGNNYDTYAVKLTGKSTYNWEIFNIYSNQVGSSIQFAQQSNSSSDYSMGGITFTGCNSSGFKAFQSIGAGQSYAGQNGITYLSQGVYRGTSTISSISIISSNGNFDNGTLYVYTSA